LEDSRAKKIPLLSYYDKTEDLEVFQLTAKATFRPIDLNIFALTETMNWSLSDRMRFWYAGGEGESLPQPKEIFDVKPQLFLRKLDTEEDAFCQCQIDMHGEVLMLSNDSKYAEGFFVRVFVNVPPSFHGLDDWEISKEWIRAPLIVAGFCGSLSGARGWTDRIPPGIERSIEEAKTNYDSGKWNPCVVMCRRALEEIMQFAYRRFFEQEPKGLDLNDIIRKFEKEKPHVIPKHWIGALDSVRNIGNVPGAHPAGSDYVFTRVDADLALLQTVAFREAYFSKIDRDVDSYYVLEIEPNKEAEENA